MIKDFVPARTNLRSGVVVKQHLLERNKYPQPQMEWEDTTYTGSIDTAFITGSTGGTFNEFNYTTLNPLNITTNLTNVKGLVAFFDGYYDQNDSNPFNTYHPIPLNSSYPKYVTNVKPISLFEFESLESGLFTATYSAPTTFYLTITPDDPTIDVDLFVYKNGLFVDEIYGEISATTTFAPFKINITNGDQLEFKFVGSGGGIANIYIYAQADFSQQNWLEPTLGPSGSTFLIRNDQSEFYNGELQGTTIEASNGELNEANIFKQASTDEIKYNVVFYQSSITPLGDFLNQNTSPNQGEIYLWYDTGSTLNPGQTLPIPGGGGSK
jgi:hypothetical protein